MLAVVVLLRTTLLTEVRPVDGLDEVEGNPPLRMKVINMRVVRSMVAHMLWTLYCFLLLVLLSFSNFDSLGLLSFSALDCCSNFTDAFAWTLGCGRTCAYGRRRRVGRLAVQWVGGLAGTRVRGVEGARSVGQVRRLVGTWVGRSAGWQVGECVGARAGG